MYTHNNITLENFETLWLNASRKPDRERNTCRANMHLRGVETESQDHPAIYEENNKSGTSTMAEN